MYLDCTAGAGALAQPLTAKTTSSDKTRKKFISPSLYDCMLSFIIRPECLPAFLIACCLIRFPTCPFYPMAIIISPAMVQFLYPDGSDIDILSARIGNY
jgi:hypothetical protein